MGLRQKRTVMLAGDWNASMDPRGWLVSEKFNGWRAEFDGTYLRSSSGRVLDAPGSLLRALPPIRLDGELWLGRGRGNLQDIGSIVAHATDPRWGNLFYVVFDTPDEKAGPYTERIRRVKEALRKSPPRVAVAPYIECRSREHLDEIFRGIIEEDGEGAMLRRPDNLYVRRRVQTMMKLKRFHDAEAEVVGHQPGEGACAGMLGALVCKLDNGIEFEIGTGFTRAQRRRPPPIGARVQFRYQELSRDGTPIGSPSYQGIRPEE